MVLGPYQPAFAHESFPVWSQSNTPVTNTPLQSRRDASSWGSPPDNHESQNIQLDNEDAEEHEKKVPPHRYLFHCYIYQYHLMHMAEDVIEMVCIFDFVKRIQPLTHILIEFRSWMRFFGLKKSIRGRYITYKRLLGLLSNGIGAFSPNNFSKMMTMTILACSVTLPSLLTPYSLYVDVIQGLQNERQVIQHSNSKSRISSPDDSQFIPERDLGTPHRRDPDALPPRNALEWTFNVTYNLFVSLGGGNAIFAVKAGLLTVVLSLPCMMKSSARLAYGRV